jgi:hypothetical protein
MIDARSAQIETAAGLSPETLRARARCRRETAARLWDERLEQLLLEEAAELEQRAAALELGVAIKVEDSSTISKVVQPDLAALREEAQPG